MMIVYGVVLDVKMMTVMKKVYAMFAWTVCILALASVLVVPLLVLTTSGGDIS